MFCCFSPFFCLALQFFNKTLFIHVFVYNFKMDKIIVTIKLFTEAVAIMFFTKFIPKCMLPCSIRVGDLIIPKPFFALFHSWCRSILEWNEWCTSTTCLNDQQLYNWFILYIIILCGLITTLAKIILIFPLNIFRNILQLWCEKLHLLDAHVVHHFLIFLFHFVNSLFNPITFANFKSPFEVYFLSTSIIFLDGPLLQTQTFMTTTPLIFFS